MDYRVRCLVDDAELTALHALAFGATAPGVTVPWQQRLDQYAVTWVGAFDQDGLQVGFAQAVWDGGRHAFLLDTIVHPEHQRRGVGRTLVSHVVVAAREAGCEWLHVDFEPHLRSFYWDSCGFRPTDAGLVRLR
ncbi:MAG: GNAT family N-acetyltransferase [Actinomycetota bacterium]|nr:GNAT family N-acetyltransferase [Actinomycetota bacterium]